VVCQRLTLHGQLDARGVSVTAEAGEVTLSGTVGSRWAKREAERVADSVPGVRDVHNRLRIQRGGPDVATHMGAIED
jgi:osmotically-inducible protein OsmY